MGTDGKIRSKDTISPGNETKKININTNKQSIMKEQKKNNGSSKKKGPKYYLDIEGEKIPWDDDTITTEEIIELGGWDPSKGALLIDKKTNEQRTLEAGEEIELKPGIGFSKKHKFKRG